MSVEKISAYVNNATYTFASRSARVPGLGERAMTETLDTKEPLITVKLGANAIQITVDFYKKPVDEAFVSQRAKGAVGSA